MVEGVLEQVSQENTWIKKGTELTGDRQYYVLRFVISTCHKMLLGS
jgi:hypothetical protein